jgi:uncharacterized protein YtpQ (UPF0354 family)
VSCGGERGLGQQEFTDLVQDRARAEYPEIQIGAATSTGFAYAHADGQSGQINTQEEYAYYLQRPDRLEELVSRVVSLIGDRERFDRIAEDEAQLRRSIMPVLKPGSFLAEAEARSGGQPLLYGRHETGLFVFFVVDQPTSMSFLTAGSLEGLEMSSQALARLALQNLAHRTGEDRFIVERTADGPIAVGETLDGYDATRLISPILVTTVATMLGASRFIVAAPRRDLILVAPAGSSALRERLAARARAEHASGPFPLTPALFELDREGVRPLRG